MAVIGNRGMLADVRVFVNNGMDSTAGRSSYRLRHRSAFGDSAMEPLPLLNRFNIVS